MSLFDDMPAVVKAPADHEDDLPVRVLSTRYVRSVSSQIVSGPRQTSTTTDTLGSLLLRVPLRLSEVARLARLRTS
jgi:hypothetical protein